MNDIRWLKWKSAVKECGIHILRLRTAHSHIARHMPLSASRIEKLSGEDMAWLDQLLYRFAKLQDTVGERIFVEGLFFLGEDFSDKPFIDALNRLEFLSMIPGCAWWMELREYRNQIAHEYPDRQAEQASAVNEIYNRCDDFIEVVNKFIESLHVRE